MPIALRIRVLEDYNDELLRKVYVMQDIGETFIKYLASILMADYFKSVDDEQIKHKYFKLLEKPSLGTWANELINIKNHECKFIPEFNNIYLKKLNVWSKPFVSELRNPLAHGGTPGDKECIGLLNTFLPPLFTIISESPIDKYKFLYNDTNSNLFSAMGFIPKKIKRSKNIIERQQVYLENKKGEFLNLFPFLIYAKVDGNNEDLYFYNDYYGLKKLGLLNYEMAFPIKTINEELKKNVTKSFHLDSYNKKTAIDYETKNTIEHLSAFVIGREKEIDEFELFIKSNESGFYFLFGHPGMGKSTFLAKLYTKTTNKNDVEVFPYFIKKGIDSSTKKILESIITNISSNMEIPDDSNITSLSELLKETIHKKEKCVIIIDALDEAEDIDQLIKHLPHSLPDQKLKIIFSSRNTTPFKDYYNNLIPICRKKHQLKNLKKENIRELLFNYVNKYELEEKHIKIILDKSGGNPLYLTLLCNELEQGKRTLQQLDNLPKEFTEFYAKRIADEKPQVKEILYTIATAKKIIHKDVLAEITKIAPFEIDEYLYKIEDVLEIIINEDGIKYYSLFHQSLLEFLKQDSPDSFNKYKTKHREFCMNYGFYDKHSKKREYAILNLLGYLIQNDEYELVQNYIMDSQFKKILFDFNNGMREYIAAREYIENKNISIDELLLKINSGNYDYVINRLEIINAEKFSFLRLMLLAAKNKPENADKIFSNNECLLDSYSGMDDSEKQYFKQVLKEINIAIPCIPSDLGTTKLMNMFEKYFVIKEKGEFNIALDNYLIRGELKYFKDILRLITEVNDDLRYGSNSVSRYFDEIQYDSHIIFNADYYDLIYDFIKGQEVAIPYEFDRELIIKLVACCKLLYNVMPVPIIDFILDSNPEDILIDQENGTKFLLSNKLFILGILFWRMPICFSSVKEISINSARIKKILNIVNSSNNFFAFIGACIICECGNFGKSIVKITDKRYVYFLLPNNHSSSYNNVTIIRSCILSKTKIFVNPNIILKTQNDYYHVFNYNNLNSIIALYLQGPLDQNAIPEFTDMEDLKYLTHIQNFFNPSKNKKPDMNDIITCDFIAFSVLVSLFKEYKLTNKNIIKLVEKKLNRKPVKKNTRNYPLFYGIDYVELYSYDQKIIIEEKLTKIFNYNNRYILLNRNKQYEYHLTNRLNSIISYMNAVSDIAEEYRLNSNKCDYLLNAKIVSDALWRHNWNNSNKPIEFLEKLKYKDKYNYSEYSDLKFQINDYNHFIEKYYQPEFLKYNQNLQNISFFTPPVCAALLKNAKVRENENYNLYKYSVKNSLYQVEKTIINQINEQLARQIKDDSSGIVYTKRIFNSKNDPLIEKELFNKLLKILSSPSSESMQFEIKFNNTLQIEMKNDGAINMIADVDLKIGEDEDSDREDNTAFWRDWSTDDEGHIIPKEDDDYYGDDYGEGYGEGYTSKPATKIIPYKEKIQSKWLQDILPNLDTIDQIFNLDNIDKFREYMEHYYDIYGKIIKLKSEQMYCNQIKTSDSINDFVSENNINLPFIEEQINLFRINTQRDENQAWDIELQKHFKSGDNGLKIQLINYMFAHENIFQIETLLESIKIFKGEIDNFNISSNVSPFSVKKIMKLFNDSKPIIDGVKKYFDEIPENDKNSSIIYSLKKYPDKKDLIPISKCKEEIQTSIDKIITYDLIHLFFSDAIFIVPPFFRSNSLKISACLNSYYQDILSFNDKELITFLFIIYKENNTNSSSKQFENLIAFSMAELTIRGVDYSYLKLNTKKYKGSTVKFLNNGFSITYSDLFKSIDSNTPVKYGHYFYDRLKSKIENSCKDIGKQNLQSILNDYKCFQNKSLDTFDPFQDEFYTGNGVFIDLITFILEKSINLNKYNNKVAVEFLYAAIGLIRFFPKYDGGGIGLPEILINLFDAGCKILPIEDIIIISDDFCGLLMDGTWQHGLDLFIMHAGRYYIKNKIYDKALKITDKMSDKTLLKNFLEDYYKNFTKEYLIKFHDQKLIQDQINRDNTDFIITMVKYANPDSNKSPAIYGIENKNLDIFKLIIEKLIIASANIGDFLKAEAYNESISCQYFDKNKMSLRIATIKDNYGQTT